MPRSTRSATTVASSRPPRQPDDHLRRMESIVHAPLKVHPCTEHHRFYWMDGTQKPIGLDAAPLEPLYSDYRHACEQISSYWRGRPRALPAQPHTAADVKSCQEGTVDDQEKRELDEEKPANSEAPEGSCVKSECRSRAASVVGSSSCVTRVGVRASFPNFASRDNVQHILLDPILPKKKYRHGRARLMSLYADSYFDSRQLRRAAHKCDKEHHFKRNAITEIAGEFAKQKCLMRK
ncbi:hypothetical protein FOZ60_001710 [Perkinsus olseni]|uniref:Uncharacterized protein n=1 Tax=Perkinsus olseni TaxID=32597 RepID=A0A7J6P0M9_PEROL|nr:hypothetical protein FOZ60_001710 [Perkinsus olseni]